MTVDFKFTIDEKVKNPFGEEALIGMCALDNTKIIQYHCQIKGGQSQWFREDQLAKIE